MSTTATVALSISQITTLVYAHLALDRTIYNDPAVADILCPDRRKALSQAVIGAMCELSLHIMPYVRDIVIPEDPEADEIIKIRIRATPRRVLVAQLQETLAFIALSHINASTPQAQRFAERAERAVDKTVRQLSRLTDPLPGPACVSHTI